MTVEFESVYVLTPFPYTIVFATDEFQNIKAISFKIYINDSVIFGKSFFSSYNVF